MPWTCPACREPIRHTAFELTPHLGVRYRCHICRLELQVDAQTRALTLAPLRPADGDTSDPEEGV